jgi:hypothetical protein
MNVEGFGRECSRHNWRTISTFHCRDWGKTRKPSVRITGVPNEIRTEHLPYTVDGVDVGIMGLSPTRDKELCPWIEKFRLLRKRSFVDNAGDCNIIPRMLACRKLPWNSYPARIVSVRNACRISMLEPTVKQSLWRPRMSWDDKIKMTSGN